MSNKEAVLAIGSILANSDLSATPFRFGKVNSSGKIALASTDQRPDGVIQNKPLADHPVDLAVFGKMLVEVGSGGCTAGGNVAVGANGTAVMADSGAMVCGTFLETGAAGDLRPIIFNPSGPTY